MTATIGTCKHCGKTFRTDNPWNPGGADYCAECVAAGLHRVAEAIENMPTESQTYSVRFSLGGTTGWTSVTLEVGPLSEDRLAGWQLRHELGRKVAHSLGVSVIELTVLNYELTGVMDL